MNAAANSPRKKDPAVVRRRVITGGMLMLLLFGGALAATSNFAGVWRTVDIVKFTGLMFLCLVIALRSTTNFRFGARNPALDDELTRANRASAAQFGFWAMFIAVAGVFLAEMAGVHEPILMLLMLAAGAIGAGARFAWLEGRGE
jgi:hypothetical protein